MRKSALLVLVLAALSSGSCQKKEITVDEQKGIGFSIAANWDDNEKLSRALVSGESGMRSKAFGVIARFSSGASFSSGNCQTAFNNDIAIEYNSTAGKWSYTPLRYWVPGCTYRFRALWPQDAVTSFTDDLATSAVISGFTASNIQASQTDLMLSDRVERTTPAVISDDISNVSLTFQHLLCNVNVKIKQYDDPLNDDIFTVTSVSLTGMKNKGTYTLTNASATTAGTWDVSAGSNMTCTRNLSPAITPTKNAWSTIWGDNGLLLIPQDPTNVKLLIDYSVTHNGNSTSKSVSLNLPATPSWQAGQKVMYQLTINQTYDIIIGTPEVEPWGTSPSTGTILIK